MEHFSTSCLFLTNSFIHSFMDVLPLTNACSGGWNRINVETEGLRYSSIRWRIFCMLWWSWSNFCFHVNQTKCGMFVCCTHITTWNLFEEHMANGWLDKSFTSHSMMELCWLMKKSHFTCIIWKKKFDVKFRAMR